MTDEYLEGIMNRDKVTTPTPRTEAVVGTITVCRRDSLETVANLDKVIQHARQLEQELIEAKGTHGYTADYWFEQYEGQRNLAVELAIENMRLSWLLKRDQWKEDAERLATELHCYTQWVTKRSIHEALSLHEQLMKGTKK